MIILYSDSASRATLIAPSIRGKVGFVIDLLVCYSMFKTEFKLVILGVYAP